MVNTGDRDAAPREFAGHPRHQALEVRFGVIAAADAGLVGGDHYGEALGGEARRQIEDAVDEPALLDAMEIAAVLVDDAVAVENETPAGSGHGKALLCRRSLPQGGRDGKLAPRPRKWETEE